MGDDPTSASHLVAVTERLTRQIPLLLREQDIPGLAVAVCDASRVLWAAGFGSKRAGGLDPVTTETMFSVQSISKMYTAFTVMLAVQGGLVELDRPITSYLPWFTVRSTFEQAPERRPRSRPRLPSGPRTQAPARRSVLCQPGGRNSPVNTGSAYGASGQ